MRRRVTSSLSCPKKSVFLALVIDDENPFPFLYGDDVPLVEEEWPFVEVDNAALWFEWDEPFANGREPFEFEESWSRRIVLLMRRLRFGDGGVSRRGRGWMPPASVLGRSLISVLSNPGSSTWFSRFTASGEGLRRRRRGLPRALDGSEPAEAGSAWEVGVIVLASLEIEPRCVP